MCVLSLTPNPFHPWIMKDFGNHGKIAKAKDTGKVAGEVVSEMCPEY